MSSDQIEDIYALSPMQTGMLFHTLYAGEHAVYLDQMVYELKGDLNVSVFKRAWKYLVERHATLRTTFHWEGLDEPLQVVHASADLPLERHDWSNLPNAEQRSALDIFLKEDQARIMDLSQAPLMRLILIQISEDTWKFIWTLHHLLLDRWSITQVLSELNTVYEALCSGQKVTLPPLRPYGDYIGWIQEQDSAQAEAYWRRRLAGLSTATALPIDRAPGSQPGQEPNARQHVRLSEATSSALQSLARQHRLTMNTLVQGAWALLLSRYSGEEDVLFGTTVSGRPASLAGVETMVGLFINSLPVRVHISESARLVDWLRQLQEDMSELREYEHSSLLQIQNWSDIPRGVSLFDSLVIVQNTSVVHSSEPQTEEQRQGNTLKVRSIGSESTVDFPLLLLAVPGKEMGLWLSYDITHYAEEDIVRLLGHLSTVLEAMVADTDQRVSRLPLLSDRERHRLLTEWNDTQMPYPKERCLHELFEAQAAHTPHALAVECEGRSLTYSQLDTYANRLAHALRRQGVGPEALVGVCVERSCEMLVALLAILKAGGAYVPLDPHWPSERLAQIAAGSHLDLALTQTSLRDLVPASISHRICLDEEGERLAQESSLPLGAVAASSNLAYVLYTSGSTGAPKGVQIPHCAVVNFLTTMAKQPGLTADDTVLAVTTLSFDIAGLELFLPLTMGARVVIARREETLEGERLARLLLESDATVMQATPATWRMLLTSGWSGDKRLKVLCGGEALPLDLARSLVERCGTLWNLYGPTETTIWSSAVRIEGAPRQISIGRPIGNTQLYLLDRRLEPVAVGVSGELYIGGDGLARGYLGRPDLTAEKFVADPFSTAPGSRLYRTGDLCRYLADGAIEYLGRLDHQVKVRGFRIELGEIESVLLQHPGVKEAVVVAREDVAGDRRLAAYIVSEAGEESSSSTLREHLRSKLPDYMTPSAFVFLEALPLSANGKIDRKALPMPEAGGNPDAGYVAPRTPLEEGLAEIWQNILRVEQVGIGDSFFDLGGHSLLATQMISRVRTTFQVELPLRVLFEAPTVADMAQRISLARGDESALSPPLIPAARTGTMPLSFSQQRLWFLDQLEPGSAAYNVPGAMRLLGVLNMDALQQSLAEIVRRHEALRTTFRLEDGVPCQFIHAPSPYPLPLVDLSSLPETQRDLEAQRLIQEEARRPFYLAQGPVFRSRLLRLGEEDHVLLWTVHHIVSDGWSMGVLRREFAALYNAFSLNKPSPLSDLPIQYADYALWQRGWLQGVVLERQIAYWKEQLSDAPSLLELPTDRPRPHVQTFHGALKRRILSPELAQGLKALGQHEGVTLFMTLLAAFQTLLSRYSGQDQIVVGTPIANRTQSELEGLIGSLMNTLALRGDLSGDPAFRELLGRVRESCLGAYAHQDLPFEKLVEELQPERSLSHSAIFQVMLVLQNAPRGAMKLEGLRIEGVRGEGVTAKFDLLLAAGESENGLGLGLEYNTDLFDGETIERMLGHFEILLEAIVSDPEQKISRLPLLTQPEERQLLVTWNDTASAFPDLRLHQLVERQADGSPEAIALRFEGETLTYQELETRANQLAHHLRLLGIGRGAFVGVALERSLDVPVALLGVLKAGAAYIPLDPDYPTERLVYMLADSQVKVLLSQTHVADRLPPTSARLICLDADWPLIASQPADRLAIEVDREETAYVIYTSGSTGRPKGVLIPHRAIQNHMHWMQQSFPLTAEDRVLQKTPLSFDASVWECWSALMTGASLVIARPGGHMDPGYLVALIQETGITTVKLVPSLLQMLVSEPGFSACASLRQVFCGAEALSRDLAERFYACFGDRVALHNLYGPTEAAIDATGFSCAPGWERAGMPIGRPISNVSAYILDKGRLPVPIGVNGELYLGGESLARGYLNAGELTAEKFVPDPFSSKPGERLYRTGDLCRYLSDGNIEYLGRLDYQVKVRGFRIELGEIESALREVPGVQEAVVLAREDEPGSKRLVAYLAGEETALNPGELRAHLKAHLPEYMLPSAFVILNALPLSPSGKVDRKALPAPTTGGEIAQEAALPRTPIEEGVSEIWREVLCREQVNSHDDFFDLGGHSLLATQVISRVRETFAVDLPLRTLFDAPTIAGMAEHIQQLQRAGEGLLAPPLLPRTQQEDLPLSFSQQRLWFIDQLQPASPLYNVPRSLRMRGRLDREALERALGEIVARHEVLRTTYQIKGTAPVQVISPDASFSLPVSDLSQLSREEAEAEALRLCREEAARPFSLSADTMMRAGLLRMGEEEHILLLTLHHIASDGWSSGLLTRELSALYNAFRAGRPSPLPALPVQYADYALWQRDWLQGEALERQADYWRKRLGGAPPVLALPTDRPRELATGYEGGRLPFVLSENMAQSLRRLCRETRATQFMALLGAFKVLLYRWTGKTDLVVGTDVAGRTQSETEGLIGFFLNHLVLRTDLSGDISFVELLGRVREVCLGAYAHQDLPFDKLVEVLQPERNASHTPIFQVLFVVENVPRGRTELNGLELERVGSDFSTSKFDLSLFLGESSRGLGGLWVYRKDLFDAGTIAHLSDQFLGLLEQLLSHSEIPIEDIELIVKREPPQRSETVGGNSEIRRGARQRVKIALDAE